MRARGSGGEEGDVEEKGEGRESEAASHADGGSDELAPPPPPTAAAAASLALTSAKIAAAIASRPSSTPRSPPPIPSGAHLSFVGRRTKAPPPLPVEVEGDDDGEEEQEAAFAEDESPPSRNAKRPLRDSVATGGVRHAASRCKVTTLERGERRAASRSLPTAAAGGVEEEQEAASSISLAPLLPPPSPVKAEGEEYELSTVPSLETTSGLAAGPPGAAGSRRRTSLTGALLLLFLFAFSFASGLFSLLPAAAGGASPPRLPARRRKRPAGEVGELEEEDKAASEPRRGRDEERKLSPLPLPLPPTTPAKEFLSTSSTTSSRVTLHCSSCPEAACPAAAAAVVAVAARLAAEEDEFAGGAAAAAETAPPPGEEAASAAAAEEATTAATGLGANSSAGCGAGSTEACARPRPQATASAAARQERQTAAKVKRFFLGGRGRRKKKRKRGEKDLPPWRFARREVEIASRGRKKRTKACLCLLRRKKKNGPFEIECPVFREPVVQTANDLLLSLSRPHWHYRPIISPSERRKGDRIACNAPLSRRPHSPLKKREMPERLLVDVECFAEKKTLTARSFQGVISSFSGSRAFSTICSRMCAGSWCHSGGDETAGEENRHSSTDAGANAGDKAATSSSLSSS